MPLEEKLTSITADAAYTPRSALPCILSSATTGILLSCLLLLREQLTNPWFAACCFAALVVSSALATLTYFELLQNSPTQANSTNFSQLLTRYQTLREHYELLTTNIAASVIISDNEGAISFCSPYTEVLTGYPSEEIKQLEGDLLSAIVVEEDCERYERARKICELGEEIVARYRIRHRGGIVLWVETHFVPVLDSEGVVSSCMGVSIDVTQSVHYQERVEEQNRDLNDFSYMVSHDLKAPVFTIKGMATLLDSDCADDFDDEARDCVTHIIESTGRLETLIQSIVEYSALTTKQIEITEVDLAEVVQNVLDDFSSQIEQTAAKLVLPESYPSVRGNTVRLYQVFSNLIGNAIKYRDPSRALEIAISVQDVSADKVGIVVRDNGLGIPKDKIELIFRPYQRAHGKEIEGSGIGLACVKKIVERFEGSVYATSEQGSGSSFVVTLKRGQPAAQAIPKALERWYE